MYFKINGKNVEIRKANTEDAHSYYSLLKELRHDPLSFILVNYRKTMPEYGEIEKLAENWNKYPRFMHFAVDPDVIGFVGTVVGPEYGPEIQPHIAEIFYGISSRYRHNGLIYAILYAALNDIDVKYITATVFVENAASVHVLENMGMKNIARLEENDLHSRSGCFHDDYLFRGLRSVALKNLYEKFVQHGISLVE
ncbi:MAG: GNAT family N-acetyltransferase [Thermoplasmata archaeon]